MRQAARSLPILATAPLLALLAASPPARAENELRELYRGARAQAMGNAFTAVADDEEALFYNPAGLAGIKKFSLLLGTTDLEISNDIPGLILSGQASQLGQFSGDTINQVFMGKDIYARATFSPLSLIMQSFGVSMFLDDQYAILAKNTALPQMTIGYESTNGIQFGYGTSILGRKLSRGDLRMGIGGKVLWRRGGYHLLTLNELVNVGPNTLGDIAGNYVMGFGGDLGLQYIHHVTNRFDLSAGWAYTEIGGISFGDTADPQPSNMSIGVAATYRLPASSIILSYDYRHLTDDADWRKKSHLGIEFNLPFISVETGLNQGYFTYGASFDAWLFKITFVSYAEEMGALLYQDTERRYLMRFTFKFGL